MTGQILFTQEEFLCYKSVNTEILPELIPFIEKMNLKSKPKLKPSNWRHKEIKPSSNWLLEKKFNQNDDEKLSSQFMGILNKMTESNFDELAQELISLGIKREQHVIELVNIIFQKAISENKFCSIYAKLAKTLSSYYIEDEEKKIYFREVLINKSQKMFMECISIDRDLEYMKEKKIFKFKEQVIGCINFIGELYNHELLTNKIIYSCFLTILIKLNLKKAYIIDILCSLMKTVHPEFLNRAPKESSECLEKIKHLQKDETLSKKDQFTLLDAIELWE